MCAPHPAKLFLKLLKPRLPQMLSTLRNFVIAESPSLEKSAADRCCGIVAAEWRKRGVRVERIRAETLRRSFAHHLAAGKIASIRPASCARPLRHRVRNGNAREYAISRHRQAKPTAPEPST